MRKNYAAPKGMVVLLAITFLFTSYIPSTEYPIYFYPNPGSYELLVSGSSQLHINGPVTFKTGEAVSGEGMPYPTLKLKLQNQAKSHRNFLDLYLSDPKLSNPIEKGTYAITEQVEGFFKDFKGVFGFAEIDHFGELPYFSRKGRITIYDAEKEYLSGCLELILSNTLGEIIEVKGNFVACLER